MFYEALLFGRNICTWDIQPGTLITGIFKKSKCDLTSCLGEDDLVEKNVINKSGKRRRTRNLSCKHLSNYFRSKRPKHKKYVCNREKTKRKCPKTCGYCSLLPAVSLKELPKTPSVPPSFQPSTRDSSLLPTVSLTELSKTPSFPPSFQPSTTKPISKFSVTSTGAPTYYPTNKSILIPKSLQPSNVPTSVFTQRYRKAAAIIKPIFPDYHIIQQKALNYLVNNDTMFQGWIDDEQKRPPGERMIQRYIMTVVGMSLNMEGKGDWLSTEKSECEWQGITCVNVDIGVDFNKLHHENKMGQVTIQEATLVKKIKLARSRISGTIPMELGSLQNLTLIDLKNNAISGNIPNSFGQLHLLQSLVLENNQLNGSIPIVIGSLTTLERLNLKDNLLIGSIPRQITGCRLLTHIDISNNAITGSLPDTIGSLSLLKDFRASSNNLIGKLPLSMSQMKSLKTLYLDNNRFSGELNDLIVQGWEVLGEFILLLHTFPI